jgi:hypothetical protein
MQKLQLKNLAAAASFLLLMGSVVSCTKATVTPSAIAASSINPNEVSAGTTSTSSSSGSGVASYSPSAKWKNRADGIYTIAQATQDYNSPVNGWADTRMSMSAGKLRTTLTKNVVGPEGGLVSWIDVPDGSEYQIQYDMMFGSGFDFSAGGKVGFGFLLGAGYTGGESTTDGNGGSARIMWYHENNRTYLKPYLYYRDQPGTYGDDFGKTFPASGNIQAGQWYNVKMYIKSNTGSNTNGRIQIVINGITLLDKSIRWTTNDLNRLVNRITFETFRGGADASWTSPTDGQIYFDNLSWTELSSN